jgi:sugar lactone lactonase YvrE
LPGDSTTLLATPNPATRLSGDPLPTGTVTFYDGNSALGTVPLSPFGGGTASASFRPASLTPGLHAFSASYSGDAVYAGSTSPITTIQVDALPVIGSAASAAGIVGQPVSFLVGATGFPVPVVTATGSLDGLTLTPHPDGTATLAGRPLKAGTFPITVTASNGLLPAAVQRFTFTATLSPLSVSPAALPPAFVGQAYTAALAGVGGTPPVTWAVTAGKLPAGLTLNRTTGTLTGIPTTAGTSTFTVRATDSTSPTPFTASRAITLPVTGIVPAVYVTNGANDSVTSYPLGAHGSVAPATRLAGTAQGLNGPSGVVLDDAGRLYVADGGAAAITEYDRGATTPVLTLAGPATGLAGPAGLTLDGSGRLVVADRTANAVRIFVAGVSGNTGPVVTLTGPDTGLASPAAVAVDGSGRLWVANSAANSLTAYAPGATGDARPVVTIAGSATGLRSPQALTVDGVGDLLVANTFGASITVYAPTAGGNALPLRTISGSATGLGSPAGIDLDSAGRIWVSDEFANAITSYPATANGDVAPLATISGAATGLAGPGALAITPPLSVLTGALPRARVGHTYESALSAGQGASPYRWSVVRGQLPPGLRLTAAGAIVGTPTRAGSWAVTVRVADSAYPAGTADRRLSLTVAPR